MAFVVFCVAIPSVPCQTFCGSEKVLFHPTMATGWRFQPTGKNRKIGQLPQIGVRIQNVWNHHLVNDYQQIDMFFSKGFQVESATWLGEHLNIFHQSPRDCRFDHSNYNYTPFHQNRTGHVTTKMIIVLQILTHLQNCGVIWVGRVTSNISFSHLFQPINLYKFNLGTFISNQIDISPVQLPNNYTPRV